MKRFLLVILFFVALRVEAGAAPLTLEECVELALRNNKGLKSAEAEVTIAREDVAMSKASFFPVLKLKAAYSLIDKPMRLIVDRNSFGGGIPPGDAEIITQDRDYFFLTVSLEQPLFTGWRMTHTLKKSKVAADEALLHTERTREHITFQVKKSYYDVLNARLQVKVAEQILVAKKERLRVLSELNQEGYVRKDDLLRQESDIALLDLDVDRTKHREQMALSTLKRLLYLDDSTDFSLKGVPRSLSLSVPLKVVKQFAVSNSNELKIVQARLRGADDDIAIAKSAYYPRATIQGNYLKQKDTNITRSDQWILTASLDWSIFEWGKSAADVRQKVANKQRLQYLSEEQQQSVLNDVERAWRDAKEKELGVRIREKRVKLYENILRITAERYSEGTVKLVDVIELEAQFVQEFNQYMMTINELNAAVAAIDLATSGAPASWFVEQSIYTPAVELDLPRGKTLPSVSSLTLRDTEATPRKQAFSTARMTDIPENKVVYEIPSSDSETIIESLLHESFTNARFVTK